MVHRPYSIQMVEGIVNLLTLLTNERLHETTIVVDADHCRDITLQLRHLAGCPRREIAERHFVAFADDVVKLVEHTEIDIVNLLHLTFQHLGLHHRVEQHLVRSLDSCQHIETLHQIRHSYIVMSLCFLLTSTKQVFMQQPVRMVGVEDNIVRIIGIRMNPDSILTTFEHASQDGCQRAWAQLCICHRQHVGHQRRVCHIPVEILRTPLGVEPPLVQVAIGLGRRNVSMGLDTFLKVFPHIEHDALVVPPVNIMFLRLFEIRFPSIHDYLLIFSVSL